MKGSIDARPARHLRHRKLIAAAVLSVTAAVLPVAPGRAADPPTGFREVTVFSGLTNPTTIEFAADGRIFVAEKSGLIKIFDDLDDTTPTTFADLRTNVHNFWDRGLLGMALHPAFPTTPYVYVLYAHDALIGGTAPRWGTPGGTSDPCPTPPGATGDGCVVSGRLSKLEASGNSMVGPEQVLIEDWCQQYPSHSTGALQFGADGALYVSSGDGASFSFADYGQDGSPVNPCGDPPGTVGSALTPPTAEGGALRSQDLRTTGDPTSLDGAILRVDPETGAGLPDNPLASSLDANDRRIIAHGLRNPFRFGIKPGTNEVWAGDVGWNLWEEINKISNPTDATVKNFGWPCYEGTPKQSGYDELNLNICENLYGETGAVSDPFFAYHHADQVVPGESCPTGSSALAGVAFYQGGSYPAEYDGAMFFADYSRSCIWVMFATNGEPDPATRQTFVDDATGVVDLEIGPGGDLYYVDLNGSIKRIEFEDPDPPSGVRYLSDVEWTFTRNGLGPAERDMSNGEGGAGDGNTLTLDGQTYQKGIGAHSISEVHYDMAGECTRFLSDVGVDDEVGTGGSVLFRVVADGSVLFNSGVMNGSSATKTVDVDVTGRSLLKLQVSHGGDGTSLDHADWAGALLECEGGGGTPNQGPTATISAPLGTTTWKVDDSIPFSGSATDPEDGSLPASGLEWDVILHHCPSTCHEHPLQSFEGIASGSFVAPDHEYPSHLEFRLTATDSGGKTDTKSVLVQPQTVALTFATNPAGLELALNSGSQTAPFTQTVIVGSSNSISATSPQALGGNVYEFSAWSDGGAQTHQIVAPATATTFTATFEPSDGTELVITDVTVSQINRRAAFIEWTTNVPATSQVEYGTTTAYGSSTELDSSLVTQHLVKLKNLAPNTTYNFRVLSQDALGNPGQSGNFTFQTKP